MRSLSVDAPRSREVLQDRAIVLLGLLHGVGLVGFGLEPSLFRRLVPLHLLLCFAVWAINQRTWDASLGAWVFACGALGFLAEVVGVQTGLIFGTYSYGATLGWSVGGVPVMMAVNWALLVAVVGDLAACWGAPRGWGTTRKALVGAFLLFLLDLVMEPFAVSHDLWRWEEGRVPLHNYVGWVVLSFLLLLPYHGFRIRRENRSSLWVYVFQLFFFCGQLPWTMRTQ